MTFTYRHSVQMSEDRLVQTKSALKDLVELRNDLVHHLIERFTELRRWATTMAEGHAVLASFMQTDTFRDSLVNGIAPDGTIDWPAAGIVRALREASKVLMQDDWTCLAEAVAWIGERHSEQTPEKYGCKSWPDVLHKSRAFDLVYRPDAAGRKVGWYRERV